MGHVVVGLGHERLYLLVDEGLFTRESIGDKIKYSRVDDTKRYKIKEDGVETRNRILQCGLVERGSNLDICGILKPIAVIIADNIAISSTRWCGMGWR